MAGRERPRREVRKVLFVDISGTVTDRTNAAGRKVDPEAIRLLAEYAKARGVHRVFFITALPAKTLLRGNENVLPFLRQNGIDGISEIWCENGAYKLEGGRPVMSPEANAFLKERKSIAGVLDAELSRRQKKAENASGSAGYLVQLRYDLTANAPNRRKYGRLAGALNKTLEMAGLDARVRAHTSYTGVFVRPTAIDKGRRAFQLRWGLQEGRARPPRITGKAFGDARSDRTMAGGNIKFVKVDGTEHFKRLLAGWMPKTRPARG